MALFGAFHPLLQPDPSLGSLFFSVTGRKSISSKSGSGFAI